MAGKGSVEKRGENTWRLIVSAGMKDDKQVKKKKSVTTTVSCPESSCRGCSKVSRCKARKEVEKLLAEFVLEIEKGVYFEPTKLTFKDFADRWLRDYAEKELAPTTTFRYRQLLDSRIYPAMGHLAVEKITPVHLMEFYANIQEEGIRLDGKAGKLSPTTIRHHHRLISSILNTAVQWQVLSTNPAARIKPPRVPKKIAGCYDEQQTASLLAAMENEPFKYQVAIALAIDTGVREGELMGLTWPAVDFENNTIEILQSAQYLPGKGNFTKLPKNETSLRIVSITPSVMALLRRYKAHQAARQLKAGDLWQGTERLFTTWDGRPTHTYSIGTWFAKFLKRTTFHKPCNMPISKEATCPHCNKPIKEKDVYRLPPLPFHGLRHTAATLLISTGMDSKTVSGRFGHSNIGTTYDIYGHYLKSADREAADRIEQVYQRMKGNDKETKKEQA